MTTTNKIELPDFDKSFKFTHQRGNDVVYTCSPNSVHTGFCELVVTWETGIGRDHSQIYSRVAAERCIKEGTWSVIPEKQSTWSKVVDDLHIVDESLLDQMKAFTTLTGASIFIHPDGEYDVYYDSASAAKAKSDEDMEKLMDAIEVLHVATYGE